MTAKGIKDCWTACEIVRYLASNPDRQLDISYRILLYSSASPATYASYSTFSPFSSLTLSSAHSCVYAISSFPLWLLCTTQIRCTTIVGASTMVTRVGLNTLYRGKLLIAHRRTHLATKPTATIVENEWLNAPHT